MSKFRVTDATLDVLEALLDLDDPLYGLKIAKQTNRPTGSVFPILARLETSGWIRSFWETEDRPERGARRRLYKLTEGGMREASKLLTQRRGRPLPTEFAPPALKTVKSPLPAPGSKGRPRQVRAS